jgi:hypothetical protein
MVVGAELDMVKSTRNRWPAEPSVAEAGEAHGHQPGEERTAAAADRERMAAIRVA